MQNLHEIFSYNLYIFDSLSTVNLTENIENTESKIEFKTMIRNSATSQRSTNIKNNQR